MAVQTWCYPPSEPSEDFPSFHAFGQTSTCPQDRRVPQREKAAAFAAPLRLYYARNPRKALELASEATQAVDFKAWKACVERCLGQDWWWKARLGKAYYQLGASTEMNRNDDT